MDNKSLDNGGFIAKGEQKPQPQKEVKKTKKKDSNKKPNIFKRIWGKMKDVFSELKKVSWPTFPKVVKQTCVVLVVVLCFLVVIGAFDFGLFQLLKLVAPGTSGTAEVISSIL